MAFRMVAVVVEVSRRGASPRISEWRKVGVRRVLGSGSLGDEQSVLWRQAYLPLRFLGPGDYPPQCAPKSRIWRCHCPV